MFFLSKMQLYLLLVSAFCFAPAANASNIEIDLTPGSQILAAGTTDFSRPSIERHSQFTDTYFFTLGSGYDLVSASLSGSDLSSLSWSVSPVGSSSLMGTANNLSINFDGRQAAGDYMAVITGKATGSNSFHSSHNYSGYFTVAAVSAVPEAKTYAMLLAGLGLIGLISHRRQSKETAVPA
jgi:hypothetical protein